MTTGAVIAWAPRTELTYSQFTLAIGMPMTVILPIIAVALGDVRVEPTHRSRDVHPRPAPRAGDAREGDRLPCSSHLPATVVAFSVGALGNVAAAQLAGIAPVWDR